MIINVECGEPSPVLSCSQKPAMLQNIDLNGGNVEINLDHLALSDNLWGNLFSADDPFGPRLEFGGSGGKTIIIRSDNLKCNEIPCDTVKMNFNVCTSGFGCQERFTASACPCSKYNLISLEILKDYLKNKMLENSIRLRNSNFIPSPFKSIFFQNYNFRL